MSIDPHFERAIDRSVRELEQIISLVEDYDMDEMTVQALRTAIESLHLRKAGAKDKERIDWLEANETNLSFQREYSDYHPSEYTLWWQVMRGSVSVSGHPVGCLREAIDIAISRARHNPTYDHAS